MVKLNNNKLQVQRNFQSIWHSESKYISKTLREDQLIRDYIIGTMKAKNWKISEIIIKRKVKLIHIAFQIQYKKIKERKRWTKNRLRNRIKYLEKLKLKRKKSLNKIKSNKRYLKKRLLFFQLFLMIVELRKMYPQNSITFYIQRVWPLQFNSNLINAWIIANLNKKKSYRRLINQIISKFEKAVKRNKSKFQSLHLTWKALKPQKRKNLVSWITANLIYLFNSYQSFNHSPLKKLMDSQSQLISSSVYHYFKFIPNKLQRKNSNFNTLWFRYLNSKIRKFKFKKRKTGNWVNSKFKKRKTGNWVNSKFKRIKNIY